MLVLPIQHLIPLEIHKIPLEMIQPNHKKSSRIRNYLGGTNDTQEEENNCLLLTEQRKVCGEMKEREGID